LLTRGPEWVVVDTTTGALIRSRASGWPVPATDSSLVTGLPHAGKPIKAHLGPELDVVAIELAEDDEPPDPARPEAVMVRNAPELVGTPRRRAVRRILKELEPVDRKRPLLGSLGPSISYVDLDGSRPSVVVVAPDRAPTFACDATGTWCRFSLGGRKHRLPITDSRLVDSGGRAANEAIDNAVVFGAIGGAPRYLVVALGAPRQGQTPKVVLGVLPRP
jgi:hypothetical protein